MDLKHLVIMKNVGNTRLMCIETLDFMLQALEHLISMEKLSFKHIIQAQTEERGESSSKTQRLTANYCEDNCIFKAMLHHK